MTTYDEALVADLANYADPRAPASHPHGRRYDPVAYTIAGLRDRTEIARAVLTRLIELGWAPPGPVSDRLTVDLTQTGADITQQVAWAIHCWTCPLCGTLEDMAGSGQGHVTDDHLRFAVFLVGALGLEQVEPQQ